MKHLCLCEDPMCLPHLRHHAVCTCVLLILEDDVRVVVCRQLLKALGTASYLPLISPTGSQRFFGNVRTELLIGERREFPCSPSLAVTSARSTAVVRRRESQDEAGEERRCCGESHANRWQRHSKRWSVKDGEDDGKATLLPPISASVPAQDHRRGRRTSLLGHLALTILLRTERHPGRRWVAQALV